MKTKHLTVVQALSVIVLSCLFVTPLSHILIKWHFRSKYLKEKKGQIECIIESTLHKEGVDSLYFMELLGLSLDNPVLFKEFDVKKGRQVLSMSPIFVDVEIEKIPPNMIHIDYSLRKPIAWVVDFYNAAIDKEGVLFPVHPFFSPKRLPAFYLGEENGEFGKTVKKEKVELALAVLFSFPQVIRKEIKQIDVSKAFAESLGLREIVIVLEEEPANLKSFASEPNKCFLRLSKKKYKEEITNYLRLRPYLNGAKNEEIKEARKEVTIDLRLSQFAFIK